MMRVRGRSVRTVVSFQKVDILRTDTNGPKHTRVINACVFNAYKHLHKPCLKLQFI